MLQNQSNDYKGHHDVLEMTEQLLGLVGMSALQVYLNSGVGIGIGMIFYTFLK